MITMRKFFKKEISRKDEVIVGFRLHCIVDLNIFKKLCCTKTSLLKSDRETD